MANVEFNPVGQRGTLRQWTMDDGAALRAPADFDAVFGRVDDTDFDNLCKVQDHLGQSCVCVAWYPDDSPRATFEVRFDDGVELYIWSCDVWFD